MSKVTAIPASQFVVLIQPPLRLPAEVSVEGNSTPPADSDYAKWAANHGVGLPTEDQDGDGLINLLEWLFGGQPSQPDYFPVKPMCGYSPENYILYFQYIGSAFQGTECVIQVGSKDGWRPALPADLEVSVDGYNWTDVTDALMKQLIDGEITQMCRNKNKAKTPFGLIRLAVSYSF